MAATPAPPIKTHYATAYCLRGRMANGRFVHPGAVAHNFYWKGTRIRLVGRSFYGRRNFVVTDTGPALRDGHFDIWTSSCQRAIRWGKRTIRFRAYKP